MQRLSSQSSYKPSFEELRYSVGVALTWITGFSPMSFAISKPYNADRFERTEQFSFTIKYGVLIFLGIF